MNCVILNHIRRQRGIAFARGEYAEVIRLLDEEEAHIAKCLQCAANVTPLYLDLWNNARIGVQTYDPTIATHADDHHRN
jgi:hypothetical protein